ncbi:TldD/PmbA family protein [Corallococcus exiguus]|uniref:TldD/PmbA family protein n=1 Tax=Corallococcus TaxID=83461 RepID=UPI000EE58E0C|nr:TldD/PmbA family protein [Corallococcus sp. AB032C]NNC00152.1 TldD/PmbA family protein [Corallococcus exiguus]NNC09063.1 TldD/PmbA family protein [Corallococcus exiguus]NPC53055.1 TldD/PmbA family protein [Corallococcus exiguus]RKH73195.1 TldD/PmbA family protein [Corallococcus sp. AB032C]
MNYEQLAKKVVQRAVKKGAKQAEAYLEVGRQSSVRVREGQIEDLTEATSKGLGIRVIVKDRLGFAYTSDFTPAGLERVVDLAVQLAEAAAPNKLNGLPGAKDLGKRGDTGILFDPKVANLPGDWKINAALEAERAGRAQDARVVTFDSVSAGDFVAEVYLASSEGTSGGYSGTYVYLVAVPVASQNGQLQTGYWLDYKRFLDDLESPESIGREATKRAVRMLGAKPVKTQQVPVVFDPLVAASFVGNLSQAANGNAVYQQSSVLAPHLGKRLAGKHVTLVDDGLLPRGLATAPFDGEGVPTRRTPILDQGVLSAFLYDAFTARKAKARTTGNASRGYNALPGIGTTNLYLEKGTKTPEELIREVPQGLYVTALLGHGADPVSGDMSCGANGLWIENGELTHPVQEVTVAGHLLQMLKDVDAVGSDLQFRGGSVGAPTVRFRQLTVSGA